ncbi:MAG: phage tail protein [Clostridium sp.]|nr:phage tail protein [Clostridium sp.]MCM1400254.1 phage tail protein [Clostridium sp.]MCM1460967.1 hypothetical protein [Bacteroides sp.]
MKKNKIKFGLKNAHYAIVTETTDETTGEVTSTYGTPKAWQGAVSISLDPSGDSNNFYADDRVYAVLSSNTGYEGDFESAIVPDDVLTSVLGQKNIDGVLLESSNARQNYIALMFEIDGDVKARRFVLYRCMLTRPSISSKTREDSTEPETDTVTITVTPRPDTNFVDGEEHHWTKGIASPTEDAEIYNNWYKAVWVPSEPTPEG